MAVFSMALFVILPRLVAALGASDCTRTDAALSTSTDAFASLATGYTAIQPSPSAVSIGSDGLAVVGDKTRLTGVVANDRAWFAPLHLTLQLQVANAQLIPPTAANQRAPSAFIALFDSDTPLANDATIGCTDFALRLTSADGFSANVTSCSGVAPIAALSTPPQDDIYDAEKRLWSFDGPRYADTLITIGILIGLDTISIGFSEGTKYVLQRTSGEWPGSVHALKLGFIDLVAAGLGDAPTLLVKSLSIEGCASGYAVPTSSTPPPSLPAPTSTITVAPAGSTPVTTPKPTTTVILGGSATRSDARQLCWIVLVITLTLYVL